MIRIRPLQFLLLFILIMLSGCNNQLFSENKVKGPSVSPDQAKGVAQEEYDVQNIQDITLRHLTDEELTLLNDEQSQLTPVYYVITGLVDEEPVTVYVSSNEVTHHFIQE